MKNTKSTTIIRHLTLPLWMQSVIILSCLTIGVPFKTWAQNAEPSEQLTRLLIPGTSTVYYFNYPTVNSAGERIVLSSALIAWTPDDRQDGDSIESVHIYSHATIGSDEERPTSTGFSKEQILLQAMPRRSYVGYEDNVDASYVGRCIIIAPDYEGYGLTKDLPHPYLSQRLTARQVLDAVTYGLELYQKTSDELLLPLKKDWRMFGLGYSQGGAVTLAFQRLIEEEGLSDQLHFCGSICGDGPYDLVETLRYYSEDDGTSYGVETDHRKNMSTYPVVIPLIVKGMCSTHPAMSKYRIEDYLSQQLIDTGVLGWIDSKDYTTADMSRMWHDQLVNGLTASDRYYSPEQMAELFSSYDGDKVAGHLEKMFSQATFDYLSNADSMSVVPTNPTTAQQALHLAVAENSVVTGWEPQHRIQFYHSRADMVVPFGNYLAFRDAHPAAENVTYRVNDTFAETDHMTAAIFFFIELSSSAFASHYEWICEGAKPTGIDMKHFADNQRWMSDEDNWYTLDGRRLSSRPTANGVYIHNQRKVVVK